MILASNRDIQLITSQLHCEAVTVLNLSKLKNNRNRNATAPYRFRVFCDI